MSESLTAELWNGITGIYAAIVEHPFVTGLTDGSLPEDAFAYYVVQDALYLRDYARTLAVVAAKAPDTTGIEMFARHAAGIITEERALHDSLMADLGIDVAGADAAPPAPTTLAYTSYLLSTALAGSYAEGVGVVLPCYWIYYEVGKELLRRGSANPRYQKWIDTYADDQYGEVVRSVLDVADALGPSLGSTERALVERHFRVTSQYEWMFWDAGYRQERWPLPA
ncbi:MAG TPA: thiaminase II [Streptosporangiaceae bacterium]|nr:thiaminase II [Streptosporangiaceae bacterium]